MPTQATLLQRLKASADASERRATALHLLRATSSRSMIDAALAALDDAALDDSHRPGLRDKALHYFAADPAHDKGGLIREAIIRLLVRIGHPDDIDIYLKGVVTYHHQPVTDSAQNLRAAALAGLVTIDSMLGCIHATRLLGEDDTSQLNGEPSLTAVDVLVSHNQILPLYQFLLTRGHGFVRRALGEVVAKALESLGTDFPAEVYVMLAEGYLALDVPMVSSGIVNYITEQRRADLYPILRRILDATSRPELHKYTLIMLAASRDETLTTLLYDRARANDGHYIAHYREAVELSTGADKGAVLKLLGG